MCFYICETHQRCICACTSRYTLVVIPRSQMAGYLAVDDLSASILTCRRLDLSASLLCICAESAPSTQIELRTTVKASVVLRTTTTDILLAFSLRPRSWQFGVWKFAEGYLGLEHVVLCMTNFFRLDQFSFGRRGGVRFGVEWSSWLHYTLEGFVCSAWQYGEGNDEIEYQ